MFKKIVALVLLITALNIEARKRSSNNQKYAGKKTMILTFDRGGLFAGVFGVINNLIWCENHNVTPVVHWRNSSNYYVPNGYNGSTQPWEYYFEPVSQVNYDDIKDREDSFIHYPYYGPDKKGIPTTVSRFKGYWKHLNKDYRKYIHGYIDKYLTIKQPIVDEADDFYDKHLKGKKTIGIHMRGTDKWKEVKLVAVKDVCNAANKCAEEFPGCQFFLATDDTRFYNEAKELLNGPVITCDHYRSAGKTGIHKGRRSVNKAKLGAEVLVDVLLLARCEKLVHTRSNVSSAVLFFNPDLENVYVHRS